MREYKFRGKRPFNGEWVYGFLMDWKGKRPSIFVQNGDVDEETGDVDFIDYTVDPETVGQFTGLKDKNGKEIYEGDIVEFNIYSDEILGVRDIVAYSNGCFKLNKRTELLCTRTSPHYALEVIGNIYDNPELLKEGD